jgi:hypothetical protein
MKLAKHHKLVRVIHIAAGSRASRRRAVDRGGPHSSRTAPRANLRYDCRWPVPLHRLDQNWHQRPQPLAAHPRSQVAISASRTGRHCIIAAQVGDLTGRPSCPARSRPIACLRCKPLIAANSSRMRPRSLRLLAAYRPADATTNSSRVATLTWDSGPLGPAS